MDFDEVGLPFPIYINFVRHPVERIISWYYYVRAPWYQIEEDKYNNTVLKVWDQSHRPKKRSLYFINDSVCFLRVTRIRQAILP